MIRAKKGKLVINGHPMELLNEYRVITKEMIKMLESEGFEKENIKTIITDIVRYEFMTEEEKKAEFEQQLKEAFEGLTKVMDAVCGREEKEGADNE